MTQAICTASRTNNRGITASIPLLLNDDASEEDNDMLQLHQIMILIKILIQMLTMSQMMLIQMKIQIPIQMMIWMPIHWKWMTCCNVTNWCQATAL